MKGFYSTFFLMNYYQFTGLIVNVNKMFRFLLIDNGNKHFTAHSFDLLNGHNLSHTFAFA